MRVFSLARRDFLKAISSLLATCIAPKAWSAASGSSRRFIDVHAHFFNGADLPGKAFLRIVVLQHFPAQFTPRGILHNSFQSALEGAVLAINELIKWRAPSIETERAELLANMPAGRDAGEPRTLSRKAGARQDAETIDVLKELMGDYARMRSGEKPLHYFAGEEWKVPQVDMQSTSDLDTLFDRLAKQSHAEDLPPSTPEALSRRSVREATARAIDTGQVDVGNLMKWGVLLTKYRHEIVDTYLRMYGTGDRTPVLVAPALIDFGNWLEDAGASAQKDQIELLELISRLSGQTMVHGYAAFDPLREVKARNEGAASTPLALVKEAVGLHGFLGVKLYSPMGFRPIGNATAGTSFPAFLQTTPHLGEALDDALEDMYVWSEREGVPILSHAANSQEANSGFGCRAAPYFWLKVLEKHPNLKVCLAHFGDFSPRANCVDTYGLPPGEWEAVIGTVVKEAKSPNVYADLSYFGPAFRAPAEQTAGDKAAAGRLSAWLQAYDPSCTHLLFGTDWSMTQKENGCEAYLTNMEAFFRTAGVSETGRDNFFYRNAIRFLGLQTGGAARERLAAFYRSNGLEERKLTVFDETT
jgi:predicted TIM-barrel fold metal-dependent hydrolase